jgi:heme-degrading monooxygenase HmoA
MADVIIVSRISVMYGRNAAFENVMAQNYRFLKDQPGFKGAILQKARNVSGVYLHYARWESLEAAAAAASQEFSRQIVQQLPLADSFEPEVYEMVFDTDHLPEKAAEEPPPTLTSFRF